MRKWVCRTCGQEVPFKTAVMIKLSENFIPVEVEEPKKSEGYVEEQLKPRKMSFPKKPVEQEQVERDDGEEMEDLRVD